LGDAGEREKRMRATKIEIRARALGPGKHVDGVWQPTGQLIATLWLEQPSQKLAAQVAAAITRLSDPATGDEEVVAEVIGRQEMPSE
jgi:hypothetical protein